MYKSLVCALLLATTVQADDQVCEQLLKVSPIGVISIVYRPPGCEYNVKTIHINLCKESKKFSKEEQDNQELDCRTTLTTEKEDDKEAK